MRALAPARWLALITVLSLTACAQFPELDAVTSDAAADAPYPDLVPLDAALASAASTRPAPEDTRAALAARAAALRARASALRSRDIGPTSRLRKAAEAG